MEVFKKIKESDEYLVSSYGNVKSLKFNREIILKNLLTDTGYYAVNIWVNGKNLRRKVHRLVAQAFLENDNNKKTVNHIDGNKLNNHVSNLEWSTYSENHKHAYKIGLKKPSVRCGEDHHSSLFKNSDILFIREIYSDKLMNQYELASLFGCSQGDISNIVLLKTWGHI